MIKELEQVFDKVKKLSEVDQKRIADLISDEMNWEISFAKSQEQLSSLANEALEEYRKNETEDL
jgi:hypothetical protein